MIHTYFTHRIFCCLLLTASLVLSMGCGHSVDENRQEAPPSDSTTQHPEPSKATDPAAAARLERVRKSLEEGLDVNKTDADGRTVLMMAAFEGYTEIVNLLLENDADVNQRDSAGRTALMYGASGPFPVTVESLIKGGADVNLKDTTEGWTSLMFAAAEGHQPVVELLLEHGADITATDEDGDAAIDHARARKQSHIVNLLESWPMDR